MSALLLFCFLLACLCGALFAWRLRLDDASAAPLFLLPPAVIAATLTIAAEVNSPVARYLGLAAVLLASASLCGFLVALRRAGKPPRGAKRS